MRKEIYLPYFKDKKVTVLGLGLLGRGLGDTEFLIQHEADVICTDTRSKEKLAESIAYVTKEKHSNLKLVIGENRLEDFEDRDYILTCTGLPVDYEYLEHAKKHDIPVYMSAAFLCDIVMKNLPNVTIIGITGTRGKSTTTHLIAHILEKGGSKVHLGGNIRGVANLPLLEAIEDDEYLVLELDSWQLQGFGNMRISPNISVFTSFLDDHMNYYKNDKKLYFSDKANIYRNQNEYDVLIASDQAYKEIEKYDKKVKAIIPKTQHFDMKLIGDHNQTAAMLAYEVATQCGVEDEVILEAIKSFDGVEGRLEDIGLFNGVRIFNDNNATTPDATIAAIQAINQKYNVKPIIILGGGDKQVPLDALEKEIQENTKAHILISGSGTDRLDVSKEYVFEKLDDCIDKAMSLAKDGDILLFSPSFVSFSKYFNNEYERNDAFVTILQKYI
jgi:UDP-N-acetylmuramoylalanine--D-glutamate ligase